MLDLEAVFEKYEDEFLKFDRIEAPQHRRPDICAFLMLDLIVPAEKNRLGGYSDMVCSAEHDEIWLDTSVADLAKYATEEQIRDLVRCGVLYDSGVEALKMYA